MQIDIANCNNIDRARLNIEKGKLNIKFAPNGTGKSTIAKALIYHTDDEKLADLVPFKLRSENPENLKPEVHITPELNSVLCFNEAYVSQFTFQSDELLSNSFDIFIRTDAYIETEKEIEAIVQDIKNMFADNIELETLITNLKELGATFKLTKTGISKSSTGMKGLSAGNKIEHIPNGLEVYQPFIRSPNNVSWIDWQTKGQKEFSELSDSCPFCSSDTQDKKEQIQKVGQEYDKTVIKNLVGIISIIDKLGDYLSEDTKQKLTTITSLPEGLEKEHEQFLSEIKTQIDTLIEKLELLKTLNGFDFKQGEKVNEKLDKFKLDLQFFSIIDSEKTQAAIMSINKSIDEVSKQAGILQGKINIQRSGMQKLIAKHQTDINNFLSYAGYKYAVEISGEDDKSRLKLRHVDHDEFVSGGNQHLSFGERNAFAIVLFMYECLAKKPDLIVLDDPISSFDKNKKYAILEMLFHRKTQDCLQGDTVLMLTHDVEPIIDTVKAVSEQFNNKVRAYYLKYSNGELLEQEISKNNIKTFSQICNNTIKKDRDIILKLIYLRRNYEILDDKEDAYQVLSNLFHLRDTPIDKREPEGEDGYPDMNPIKFDRGCSHITDKITDFDYDLILNRLKNQTALKELYESCQNGYEKLQVFRLFGIDVKNSIIQKFINETYHIENEYICQLDPSEFDLIPEYVTLECDDFLNNVISS
ncbi:AAA family ATPase [Vibrio parahaemolyticus O1:K58]|nr:AAA family ATPase [Vibrio parahaemolyticus]EJG0951243.1 AAA family ATPase [Vibrio parahaemolyticus O1:K58]EKO7416446.1 AAA family ATPase [Vibrio parahaemolyticus]